MSGPLDEPDLGVWTEDEVREIESRAAARSEALAGLVEEGTP